MAVEISGNTALIILGLSLLFIFMTHYFFGNELDNDIDSDFDSFSD